MRYHIVALAKEEERDHAIMAGESAQDIADAVPRSPDLEGRKLRGMYPLPDTLTPFLRSIDDGTVRFSIDYFSVMLRELFAQGKAFADAQAACLPAFVPAETLLENLEKYDWERGIPVFNDWKNPMVTLDPAEAHHFLIGSMAKGMAARVKEQGGYPHYFASAKREDGYADIVTDAMNRKKIDHVFAQQKQWKLEPFFIHRLAPRVQELLVMSDFLIQRRKEIAGDDEEILPQSRIPTIHFDKEQFKKTMQGVYLEGRAMYEGYDDCHAPVPPSFEGGDSSPEAEEQCTFVRATKTLEREGVVHMDGGALRRIVTGLLCSGRNDVWRTAGRQE